MDVVFTEISSPTICQLEHVQFIDSIGFACGGRVFDKSELIRTKDGGATWHKIQLPLQGVDNKRLFSLDMLADGTMHIVGFGGVTYKSTNFADSLTYLQEPRFAHWTSICFRTPNDAIACGQDDIAEGFIVPIKRADNWLYPFVSKTHSFGMNHIAFPDSMTGYISGFGAIYKSTDGGVTWNFTEAKNDNFTASEWFSTQEGVAVGWEGSILKTIDGGTQWDKIRSANRVGQKRIKLKCVEQNSKNELIAAGENGCILYSNDKGVSWTELENFTDVNFESIAFQSDNTFFAVGNDGRIFKVQL